MYRFFIVLLLLALAVLVGTKITADPAYVLITWHQVAIEMPLWLVLLILITSFILFYFLIRLIKYIAALPKNWRLHLADKRQKKLAALDDQRLFGIIYQKPKNWHDILEALPQLKKTPWLSSQQVKSLQQESYVALLCDRAGSFDLATLESTWNDLPGTFKKDPTLLNLYAQALIQHHEDTKAELLIIKRLKKRWFGPMASTYSLVKSTNPDRQLALAEKWLKKHPDDPYLLLSLGRLCRKKKLWGKPEII